MSRAARGTGRRWLAAAAALGACVGIGHAGLRAIYTEIPGHPTAVVPGARDAAGNPVYAEFTVFEDLALRPDGGEWVLKGRCNLGSTLDAIMILGSGTSGTAFVQDGQPVQGGVAGELYDFFDSPVPAAWNDLGQIAYSFRAKGGSSSTYEKIAVYDPVTQMHTIVLQMGDLALGLIDAPPNPSGDERFGNSINSVHLLNDGRVGFVNTPIQNCNATRYPAFFRGNTSFQQCGVSTVSGQLWDEMDYNDCGGTPDGRHWFIKGTIDVPDTSTDDILAVDGQIVLREGSPVAGSSVTMAAVFYTHMLTDGTWFCRGDDPADNDWAVRSSVLLAKTGDPITPTESWGNTFSAFTGNRVGDWVLAGNTDSPDPLRDYVIVLNGTDIILREGDPVDLDGDGAPDDAYLSGFKGNNMFLTDSGAVWFLGILRNAAGTSLGDAFLQLTTAPPLCPGDLDCDGQVAFADIDPFVEALSYPGGAGWPYPCPWLNADCDGDGNVTFADIDPFVTRIGALCP